LGYSHGGKV